MQHSSVSEEKRAESKHILMRETDYLISEIERSESQRLMQVMRLKNVIDLVRFQSFELLVPIDYPSVGIRHRQHR
jgi:hypothetical protein